MPETFDAVKDLYKKANPDDRETYLFDALVAFRNEMISKVDSIHNACECRLEECKNRFITRKQAKWFLFVALALALGVGLGSGYLSFKEFLNHATKLPI